MKKLMLAGAIALMGVANAQVKYGLKAGYNLSNIAVSTPALSLTGTLGNKHGFQGGAFVEYNFGSNWAIQGEVLYSSNGAKMSFDGGKLPNDVLNGESILPVLPENIKTSKAVAGVHVNQVAIPISGKYTFNNKFSVVGGMGVNIVTDAKVKFGDIKLPDMLPFETQQQAMVETFASTILKDNLNTVNLTAHVGAEYNIDNNFFVDARYNFGLSNMVKEAPVITSPGTSAPITVPSNLINAKQRYFQLGVGYKF